MNIRNSAVVTMISLFSFFCVHLTVLTQATLMYKEYVQNNDQALCLDGSTASYYIRHSPTNSSRWVFYAEDGGANCIISEKLCQELINSVPYFITSLDKYHPQERNASTIFSDNPANGPWPDANFIFMNYCSQDGWLGSGYYLRGSINFKAIVSQVLKDQDPTTTELVIVGSSAGTIGVFNHIEWIVNSLHYPTNNIQMILDSFYAPVSQVTPMEDLVMNLPYITNFTSQSMTHWVDGFPCAVVYECMVATGYIPPGIKTLIISSAWDGIVYAYGTSGAATVNFGKTIEDLMDFIAGYIAFAGSVVESAVHMYYNKQFTNTTVFIAGCIHHLYIMPLDPVYRYVEVSDTEEMIARRVETTSGMWSDSAKFGSLATLKGSGGPFRWDTVNFAGSQPHTGSRMIPPQYPTPATLGQMVLIWSQSQIPDIAGDLCATSPQCGDYCNHEDISAFVIPVRSHLYQALNGFSAFLLLFVVVVIIYVVSTDAVHEVSLLATYHLGINSSSGDNTASSPTNQTFAEIYLAQKKAQTDIEELERSWDEMDEALIEEELDDFFAPNMTTPKWKSPKGRMKRQSSGTRRESFDPMDEKATSARNAVASVVGAHSGRMDYDTGKGQNLKMMALLKSWMVSGNDALLWHGIVYKADVEDKTPILNKIWGAMRYGKVTAVMGPSGCGKSTLLKVLGGEVKSGYFEGHYQKHILLRGFELVSEKKGAIGFVRQHGAGTVIPSLTVYENLFYRTCLFASRRDSFDEIHKTCTSLLIRCGLENRKDVKVTSLSGGQQKRLAIGMEILANDSVLFMDEPTSGLDASSSLEVMTLIKNEALLHGKCVALVIHQPRNEIFNLLDDLLLLKGGRTLYYGGVSWFRENIVPQLAESAFDSIGDRIIDHITTYDDLFVPSPEQDTSGLFRSDILKREFLTSIGHGGLKREPSSAYIANASPFKHEKLSGIIDQFYANLTDETSTSFLDETIPPTAFMLDAKHKPNAPELLQQLNTVLAMYGNDHQPISLQYSGTKQLNYFYRITKFFVKVIVNIRRLFLTFNFSAIIFNILLSLALYPIMSLLLLHGLGANDLFLGICFLVFFPFMFVTVAVASSMAEVYRLLIIDVEDGIYSALSLQTSLMTYFIFSSLIICATSLGAIFVVRPDTMWTELYEGLMILNLDMIFFLGMIYFCVVSCQGDPGLVFRNVTILLTFCTLFGGLLINIYKFPDFIKIILQVNPLFISAATNQYIFIGSCTLLYGDENFCRSVMMTAFGYYPYSEPGFGNGIILGWGIFFNLLAWFTLLYQQSASGVYINDATDDHAMVNKLLTSMSLRSNSSRSLVGGAGGGGSHHRLIGGSETANKEVTSTSQKSLSNIRSLPRMIQQSSLKDLGSASSEGSSSKTLGSISSAATGGGTAGGGSAKRKAGRTMSLPDHPYQSTPQKDENHDLLPNPNQIRKVQSMQTAIPPASLLEWEAAAGLKGLPAKPSESNPRLMTLERIRRESGTGSGNNSNASSGLSLVELKEATSRGEDDDLDKFLSDNEVTLVEDDDSSDGGGGGGVRKGEIWKRLSEEDSPRQRNSQGKGHYHEVPSQNGGETHPPAAPSHADLGYPPLHPPPHHKHHHPVVPVLALPLPHDQGHGDGPNHIPPVSGDHTLPPSMGHPHPLPHGHHSTHASAPPHEHEHLDLSVEIGNRVIDPEIVRQRINNFNKQTSSSEHSGSQEHISSPATNSAQHSPRQPSPRQPQHSPRQPQHSPQAATAKQQLKHPPQEHQQQQQQQQRKRSFFFPEETPSLPSSPPQSLLPRRSSDKLIHGSSRRNSKGESTLPSGSSTPRSTHGNSSEQLHLPPPVPSPRPVRKNSIGSSNGSLPPVTASPRRRHHHHHHHEAQEKGGEEDQRAAPHITLRRQSSRKTSSRSLMTPQLSFREKKTPPQVIKSDPAEMVSF